MFFFFNNEKRIGFKKLSSADLGLTDTSHQLHIGLYEGVLNFLENTDVVKSAMLLYGDYCDILDCSFDRIENPDGSFRSPKIRIGNDAGASVAIGDYYYETDPYKDKQDAIDEQRGCLLAIKEQIEKYLEKLD